ncbi:F-box/LRR-repeat protein At4g14103-like isoform X1 [Lotus japonicus]|uniref:F-box/LRR-repeat protein At4g14103-like isoform X1 n=1 Tax=Lotus japonicus TaxID=34305 RepID=UPI00258EB5A0|nr:F-box/LRR-repeat protein At4g14103-like isoform X1 [Lotus japonicus]
MTKGHCCDWISTLPDSILCFILSFLSTKQAAATSVLSKRWQPLWRSVPTLDLDDSIYYDRAKQGHARLVQPVSALVHLHHPIYKFRLRCISPFTDPANITTWVNAVVQRGGLQHLDLSIDRKYREPHINLSSIFSCKTLVVLKLRGSKITKLEPISSVYLPSLQVLHLQGLTFSEFGCLAKLLYGCPVLKDFKESHLLFENDFLIDEDIVTDIEFKALPKLLKADISDFHTKIMLEVVNNVKFLHIDEIDGILVEGTSPYIFPMFHNLTHIELEYSYYYYNNDWSEVVELLKSCPMLQVLVIYQPYFDDHVSDLPQETVYPPSMLHLKRCTEERFKFARYITEDSKEDDNMQWHWGRLEPVVSELK